MRKNHTPYWLYHTQHFFNQRYIRRIIEPQFDQIGTGLSVHHPRSLEIFGKNIRAGNNLHIISNKHNPVSLSCWESKQSQGNIVIGDNVLISPGAKIASAAAINIENNCMLAAEVYISDCDWHGVYNRTRPFRCSTPVHLKENVWVGFRSIIGKGVTIGKNSIVAAGSVVVEHVQDNVIVGGNPAKVIKSIDPQKRMITREFLFNSSTDYTVNQIDLHKYLLLKNGTFSWLNSIFAPKKSD